jgi:hypothetical protein
MTTYYFGATRHATIATIKQRAKKCGSQLFHKSTLKFYNARLPETAVYASPNNKCLYFVMSEKYDGPRRYFVRKQCGCAVSFVGKKQHATLKAAKAAAKRAAEKAKR